MSYGGPLIDLFHADVFSDVTLNLFMLGRDHRLNVEQFQICFTR